MTTIPAHVPPATRVVARAQIRAARIALRTEAIVFCVLLLAALAMTIASAVHSLRFVNAHMTIAYEGDAMIPMVLVALFVPIGVWRAEDRARRSYHWSMPVEMGSHTLLRAFGGWVWLMAAVVAYLVFVQVMSLSAAAITGEWPRYHAAWWEYAAAFTGTTVAYLVGSALVIGSAHPWRWVLGTALVWLGGAMLAQGFTLRWISRMAHSLWRGYAGVRIALWGLGRNEAPFGDHGVRWLAATAVWLAIGAALLAYAAWRHPER